MLHLTVYIFDATANTFRQLPDIPIDVPDQIQQANVALQAIAAGERLHIYLRTMQHCTA